MVDTEMIPRGRPRAFDAEAGVAIGQQLFHAHGYHGVGLAMLTEALGIKPPSFYAAYGSKAAFFGRVLERYAVQELPLDTILSPGRSPGEALADLLEQAATTYAAHPERRGCLVLEALRGDHNAESNRLARTVAEGRRACIRTFVAQAHPEIAATLTDFVASAMAGLSASAREGMDEARLRGIAVIAAEAIRAVLARAAPMDVSNRHSAG